MVTAVPVPPVPFSPAHYAQPRPVSRYDRIMGAVINGGFGFLIAIHPGIRRR